MAKIDRLAWTAGMTFTSYGIRVGLRVNDAKLLEELCAKLPPGWQPSPANKVDRLYSLLGGGVRQRRGIRRYNILYSDQRRVAKSFDLEEVLDGFENDLHLHVAERAKRRVFIHAGVVGWNGRAILIPGRSLSGKTTLVKELVQAGATYYSDEYAVLDFLGRVHPFARPLAVRKEGSFEQTRYEVESLGGKRGKKPLPVGLVVVSRYERGAKWRPRRLSPGQAALALFDNAISIRRNPQAAMDAIERVVSAAPVLKGSRGEAETIATHFLQSLGGDTRPLAHTGLAG
jgi:hypothetical protein